MEERRKFIRKKISRPIRVAESIGGRDLGYLVDISPEGLLILGNRPVEGNTVYRLAFKWPAGEDDAVIELGVESLWCDACDNAQQFWTGFQIIDISNENRDRIADFLGQGVHATDH
jgi:hypothetical protein